MSLLCKIMCSFAFKSLVFSEQKQNGFESIGKKLSGPHDVNNCGFSMIWTPQLFQMDSLDIGGFPVVVS